MVELIDNITQFIVTCVACLGAGVLYYKSRNQAYFLLTCFFGTFTLGTLNWMLNILLFGYSPQTTYASDIAWVSSYLFLATLSYTLLSPEERKFRNPAVWLVPLFGLPQLILYLTCGDIFSNLAICSLTMATAWFAVRGLIYARRQVGKARDMQYYHLAVLFIIVLEYGLWTSSCFWTNNSLANPYFYFDFLLSAALLGLLPATRKAVGQ